MHESSGDTGTAATSRNSFTIQMERLSKQVVGFEKELLPRLRNLANRIGGSGHSKPSPEITEVVKRADVPSGLERITDLIARLQLAGAGIEQEIAFLEQIYGAPEGSPARAAAIDAER